MIYPLFEDMPPVESGLTDPQIRAVRLSARAERRAQQLSQKLYECGDDIAFWAEELGYEVYEVEGDLLPPGLAAAVNNGVIAVRRGLTEAEQVVSIAHEIYHHEFHGAAVAHRDLSSGSESREENEAESFGVLVEEPSLWRYDSLDVFRYSTRLTGKLRDLREQLFYKIRK